jgi:nucleoid DNA-binding protein
METTLDALQIFTDLQARNEAFTDADLDAAIKEGAEAAAAAVARGERIFLMDEGSFDRRQNAYAMGWNSHYGTEANCRLWDEVKTVE